MLWESTGEDKSRDNWILLSLTKWEKKKKKDEEKETENKQKKKKCSNYIYIMGFWK